MDKSEKFPTFSFILLILALGPSIALAGFVLTQLWLWFVVPLGLPALGIMHAMGLQMAATALTGGIATIRTLEEIKTSVAGNADARKIDAIFTTACMGANGDAQTLAVLSETWTAAKKSIEEGSTTIGEIVQKGWVAMATGALASLLIWGVGALIALGL